MKYRNLIPFLFSHKISPGTYFRVARSCTIRKIRLPQESFHSRAHPRVWDPYKDTRKTPSVTNESAP